MFIINNDNLPNRGNWRLMILPSVCIGIIHIYIYNTYEKLSFTIFILKHIGAIQFPWNICSLSCNRICWCSSCRSFNILRARQNGRHFPDDIFKWIFWNGNVWISINISLKFVPRVPINNIPIFRPGAKPLSEPMMVRLPTHICDTRPHLVKVCVLIN